MQKTYQQFKALGLGIKKGAKSLVRNDKNECLFDISQTLPVCPPEVIYGGGFLDRNLLVAAEADIFLAMTFGDGNEVKDGGTKHTVDNMLKQGKFGYHLDLGTCRLWKNAK